MHRRIIGSTRAGRPRQAGLLAIVLLGGMLAARPAGAEAADPTIAVDRLAIVHTLAQDADRALVALMLELQIAIDAGRRGSALTIEGDRSPAPDFEEAASTAAAARDEAAAAQGITAALDGTLAAVDPAFGPLPDGPDALALPGIAAQLTSAAEASDPFVERRRAAESTLEALAEALAALQDNEPSSALDALDRADAALGIVAGWEEPPVVLPFWLDTVSAMLAAVRRIAVATIQEDAAAAVRAGRAYRRAAEEARRADTALALALSESGAALAATPLRRLADALAAAAAQRDALAAVLQITL